MQSSCNKDDQSLAPFFVTCSSLWNSTEQPEFSPSKSSVTEQELSPDDFHSVKQLDSQIQEQDSSSTLTSCQSHYGMADAARNSPSVHYIGSPHGSDETYGTCADRNHGSFFLYGNPEYGFGQVQLNSNKSAMCITFPCTESHLGGLVAAHGQNAFIYPPMVGLTRSRVPLPPLECSESIPILVNAKQFPAIIRRRQMRAKLEAQNKIAKSRKPYLHESRHVHALKRPRGAGGRFLNTANIKQPHLSFPGLCQDICKKNFVGEVPVCEAQHSESGSWETSAPSGSDATSIFNGRDIFQQPEVRVPATSSYCLGVPVGQDSTCLEAGNRLFLSMGCAQK